jgi:uncharacterized membrane protein YphA (DoxX/SURF4 family)
MSGETRVLDDLDQGSREHVERRWLSMRGGVALYGGASATCGVMDLIWRDFDRSHQPIQAFGDHIPGTEIMAYITAIVMIVGGVAILWRRSARAGAASLAIIYFVFTVFWFPRLYTAPHFLGQRIPVYVGVLAGVGMELIAFAGGALVYAALSVSAARDGLWSSQWPSWPRAILIARWIFGLCVIDFGLNHLLDVKDNLIYVPKWMPLGTEFWVILTGTCFVLAGLAILSGIQDVLAARLLALMFLAFNLLALPQFILADPHEHAAWGGNAFNLALVAANWILADALTSRRREAA